MCIFMGLLAAFATLLYTSHKSDKFFFFLSLSETQNGVEGDHNNGGFHEWEGKDG